MKIPFTCALLALCLIPCPTAAVMNGLGQDIFPVAAVFQASATISYVNGGNAGLLVSSGIVVSTGNVGIGTASPAARLHVQDGDIRISTTTGSRGIIFQDGTQLATAVLPSSPRVTIFTSNGTFTVPAGVAQILVWVVGGGGGGSGGNNNVLGAGGGGGFSKFGVFSVSPGQQYAVTIGGGGGGGGAGGIDSDSGAGVTGGATSFGALINANGGAGGTAVICVSVEGSWLCNNSGGGVGFSRGDGYYGGSGLYGTGGQSLGASGTGYAAGGAGGPQSGAGGAGTAGLALVQW